jgi:hypothetical protein
VGAFWARASALTYENAPETGLSFHGSEVTANVRLPPARISNWTEIIVDVAEFFFAAVLSSSRAFTTTADPPRLTFRKSLN